MNITLHLKRVAQEYPDTAALISGRVHRERQLTFRQLETMVSLIAHTLASAGLHKNSRLLLLVRPSLELYAILLAALSRGITCILPDAGGGAKSLAAICQRLHPNAVATEGVAWPLFLLLRALARIPLRFSPGGALVGSIPLHTHRSNGLRQLPIFDLPDNHPALITPTSGTTGVPKIAVRSHGFLEAQRRALQSCLDLQAGEIDLVSLPVFALANLAAGVTSLIADTNFSRLGKTTAHRIFAQMQRHHPNRMACSPAFIQRLLDGLESSEQRRRFSNTQPFTPRRIYIGGAPVFPTLLRRLQTRFPEASVNIVYGSTEAEPVACLPVEEYSAPDREAATRGAGLLVGKPVAGIEVRVIKDRWGHSVNDLTDAELSRLARPAGQAGEIVVSGPHVLGGYLDGVGDDENKFCADDRRWHRTGDAGRLDEQGRLWILGRCSRRFDDDPNPVYNLQIEAAAMNFDWVHQAGAITINHKRYLAISTKRRPESAEFRVFRLALVWAKLFAIVTLPSLPVDRRHNAKIDHISLERTLRRVMARHKQTNVTVLNNTKVKVV